LASYFSKRDEGAFRAIFEKCYRPVSYFSQPVHNDDIYAEDIPGKTFQKAWDARTKFVRYRHLEKFLYLVTCNAFISYLRARRIKH
jgi:DNA-directed RNA polymerase specialized sigma24 family protein